MVIVRVGIRWVGKGIIGRDDLDEGDGALIRRGCKRARRGRGEPVKLGKGKTENERQEVFGRAGGSARSAFTASYCATTTRQSTFEGNYFLTALIYRREEFSFYISLHINQFYIINIYE